jgi:hypothetical protein
MIAQVCYALVSAILQHMASLRSDLPPDVEHASG